MPLKKQQLAKSLPIKVFRSRLPLSLLANIGSDGIRSDQFLHLCRSSSTKEKFELKFTVAQLQNDSDPLFSLVRDCVVPEGCCVLVSDTMLAIALCCRPRRTVHIPCCLLTVYIQPDQIRSENCCNCDTGQARQKGEDA